MYINEMINYRPSYPSHRDIQIKEYCDMEGLSFVDIKKEISENSLFHKALAKVLKFLKVLIRLNR